MSPPLEVDVLSNQETSFEVTWFPPTEDFYCVDHYEVIWKNINDTSDTNSMEAPREADFAIVGKT